MTMAKNAHHLCATPNLALREAETISNERSQQRALMGKHVTGLNRRPGGCWRGQAEAKELSISRQTSPVGEDRTR